MGSSVRDGGDDRGVPRAKPARDAAAEADRLRHGHDSLNSEPPQPYYAVAGQVASHLSRSGGLGTLERDDVYQFAVEAMLSLHHAGKLDPEHRNFLPIKNRTIDLLRDHGTYTRAGDERAPLGGEYDDIEAVPGPEVPFEIADDADLVEQMLAHPLRDRERYVLRRLFQDGLTSTELAGEMGVTVPRVTQIKMKALGRLRRALGAKGAPMSGVPRAHVSAQMVRVLQLLADGNKASGVAKALGIGPATAKNLCRNIVWRMEAHTQAEAVANALRRGLIT